MARRHQTQLSLSNVKELNLIQQITHPNNIEDELQDVSITEVTGQPRLRIKIAFQV